MSPWLVGFTVFFGYPLVMSAYLSFTHYDLLSPAALGRARELPLPVQRRPAGLAGGEEHALVHRHRGAAAGAVRVRHRADARARAKRGVGVFRTVFYLPALAPPVAATLGFVYLLNPATGPVNTILGKLGIEGPLWFQTPAWSKPSLDAARDLGRRQHDGHLPRRDPRRAAAPLRVGGARRRRRRSGGCAT